MLFQWPGSVYHLLTQICLDIFEPEGKQHLFRTRNTSAHFREMGRKRNDEDFTALRVQDPV